MRHVSFQAENYLKVSNIFSSRSIFGADYYNVVCGVVRQHYAASWNKECEKVLSNLSVIKIKIDFSAKCESANPVLGSVSNRHSCELCKTCNVQLAISLRCCDHYNHRCLSLHLCVFPLYQIQKRKGVQIPRQRRRLKFYFMFYYF